MPPLNIRRKSPSQRRRDRLRAAQHQAKAQHHAAAQHQEAAAQNQAAAVPQPGQPHHHAAGQLGSAAVDSCQTATYAADVLLPFSGKLLQIKPRKEANVSAPETPPPPSTCSLQAAPKKPSGTPQNVPRRYVDVSAAKKQLFTTATGSPVATPTAVPYKGSRPPAAPPRATQPHQKNYQQREDQLWTKLFE